MRRVLPRYLRVKSTKARAIHAGRSGARAAHNEIIRRASKSTHLPGQIIRVSTEQVHESHLLHAPIHRLRSPRLLGDSSATFSLSRSGASATRSPRDRDPDERGLLSLLRSRQAKEKGMSRAERRGSNGRRVGLECKAWARSSFHPVVGRFDGA